MENKRFNEIDEALDFVMNRKNRGRGLTVFKQCLGELNNFQNQLRVIHIAGTNGKGSTTHFLMDVYKHNGYKVGTYTSPHLFSHLDRIRINDEWISEKDFLKYLNEYYEIIDKYDLSMFEIDTLIMIRYFIDEQVDLAIVEVGLGGRLDSTNIFDDPICSIITNIGYDHMDRLGNTIEEIAAEKAGIIRKDHKVFTGKMRIEALNVIKEKADLLIEYDESIWDDNISLENKALYQKENICLVLNVLKHLNYEYQKDLYDVLSQSIWQGRFETVSVDPKIIVDGAHNEDGVEALVKSLKMSNEKYVIVFVAMKDKNGPLMIEKLKPFASNFIVTEINMPRCSKAEDLKCFEDIIVEKNCDKAFELALELSDNNPILMCGSLYFVSWVMGKIKYQK